MVSNSLIVVKILYLMVEESAMNTYIFTDGLG